MTWTLYVKVPDLQATDKYWLTISLRNFLSYWKILRSVAVMDSHPGQEQLLLAHVKQDVWAELSARTAHFAATYSAGAHPRSLIRHGARP
jgi:hypothetical protein